MSDRVTRLREEIAVDGFSWVEDGEELLHLIDIHYAVLLNPQKVVEALQTIGGVDNWPSTATGFLPWVTMKRVWEIDNDRCSPPHFFQ
jgi:hypothetical protein